jgi:hypothetical protein
MAGARKTGKNEYTKSHTNAKALRNHKKRIKDRGGKIIDEQKSGKKTTIKYKF